MPKPGDCIGAPFWLPDATFDLERALSPARSRTWSRQDLVPAGQLGDDSIMDTLGEPLPDVFQRLTAWATRASGAHAHLPSAGQSDGSGEQLPALLREVERQLDDVGDHLEAIEAGDPGEVVPPAAYLAVACTFLALFAIELHVGMDSTFPVSPQGTLVSFGADIAGRDWDRTTVAGIAMMAELPAFVAALEAGGAVAPARWSLSLLP